ncbi:pyruvate:ferredoxin (flavodoxin) oxidoreductase [Halieaceae bacterium IMCC14734]|uniref:Pyruvate-flavodoxin oxidoreductase n=1 Tax=Candidatus Litorirhabdus singularis TaxID=2518993 RepID=A0ABT3TJX9_9GAMM|nr:pyruvate:ferredoxin (flavodoxin) oxidoreductase [Candidatus Litorirhabdus singularis]MCX2982608.1 pyruvate:ferredoxin (flavodoxin) oxidoreductase [Candidatus Litorirhabdus singularis]
MQKTADHRTVTIDGNEAAATMAHLLNEVILIYPITPASPMGELADDWSAAGVSNLWGAVPEVIEMQSEAGAAGAIHGALQAGSLATTFTASQGLLLMLPNMYKIAGELTPAVIHVAARSVATHALSIFGDHSDVMAARATGFAMLCSNSVQEALDFAFIAQAASLKGRIPVLHFFDGFRTSHEINKISLPDKSMIADLLDEQAVSAHRKRALSPLQPVIRGTSQNPDVFFQSREAINPFYQAFPGLVQDTMDRFGEATGRHYKLYEYHGDPQAQRVVVMMGSGAETAVETVDYLCRQGEATGVLKVRLFRPLDAGLLTAALPSTVQAIAVLDRSKEPGAGGEPLYKDVVTALVQHWSGDLPKVCGGIYGLSSKEFTPGMLKAVFDELKLEQPQRYFSVGIVDDINHTSLDWDPDFRTDAHAQAFQALFYGLGSDGTVGANKNSIKIIGENTELNAQGYFVYDSKKSGAVTISHLRFGPDPIHAAYLIEEGQANFVGCHQPVFLERYEILDKAAIGATFVLNTSEPPEQAWQALPANIQQHIIDKDIRFYVIDAYQVAQDSGMGKRINTIMQTCFFAISGVLPQAEAIAAIKDAVHKTYGRKSRKMVSLNIKAIDETLANLHEVATSKQVSSSDQAGVTMPADAPDFIQRVTGRIIAGHGDLIPVSALPVDGTYPLGTAAYEKRNLALEIPVWETDLCTHCGKCVFVCPHSAIRSKAFDQEIVEQAPETFKHVQIKGKDYPQGVHISYQVAPEDCTGCNLCVDICPIRDKSNVSRKAINMAPQPPLREQEAANWSFFEALPEYDHAEIKRNTMKGSMLMEPHFEFSGACVGCGETPYIRTISQLFGDRMIVANATGCSSIYGGNLPTTPWRTNAEGRGPAWNNSLFEDNAEFGLGIRVACDQRKQAARNLLEKISGHLDSKLVQDILQCAEVDEAEIHEQRERVAQLQQVLATLDSEDARALLELSDNLLRNSVWIVGGDGWAYDIGFGGVDHVLASGRDVNILVLDTEVYSNTGGQTSKATPRGAVAKFSAGGKSTAKKDLARIAMDYESVYVAHVAYGAKDTQTLNALLEAESYPGTSLVIAYSPCIAHGVDMSFNHRQQKMAVDSGHWPLFRYDPRRAESGLNPLRMDSKPPSLPYREFVESETRFNMLWHSAPETAEKLLQQSQQEVQQRYLRYQQLAALDWAGPDVDE